MLGNFIGPSEACAYTLTPAKTERGASSDFTTGVVLMRDTEEMVRRWCPT